MASQPKDTTLVQIGFNFGLNYDFVANNGGSASQIFAYLPQGIAYGLGISADNVTMHGLQPYDTTKDLGYITTLALAYVPTSLTTGLSLQLKTAVSNMYANPDPTISTLMAMINPSFPVVAGQTLTGNGVTATNAGASPSNSVNAAANGNAAPLTNTGTNTNGTAKSVSSTTVGISVGVASGALVYGAAIFFIARRYRKKKANHERSSSIMDGSHPSYGYEESMGQRYGSMMGTGAMMSGANGHGPPMSQTSGPGAGYNGHYPSGATWPSGGYSDEVMDNSRSNGYGNAHNGRDSRGSSGLGSANGRSVRGIGISAPVMAENSLGWH